ncbi:hypothetical protein BOSE62_70397 [Bosea sp. 62]|nr:hypothetical protein BOSE7B_50232 [Bosea sp. 7B]CAD5300223.1 hypothetical protein BOSE21B_91265 [Bosea sp. 21B]CAD5300697.1 hypothetical protein BOSE46_90159 [Bosea sp. 46]VVT61925.1 hypothetical protein BOS5A_231193 [Bosea sp. EC-HK365B]VXB46474.1 hypothetical protein BOSE125_130852 [Bosea sp. 125]VXC74882.1 hypothetical protein BOSE62_70397 [Bosea sp. 62]VXC91403.1 hypothetical protein BOSE29B_81213 [Bosea sp. 29B]VXC98721.1 hypothetical protein BOSE127_90233 [Bosea sp. 127]
MLSDRRRTSQGDGPAVSTDDLFARTLKTMLNSPPSPAVKKEGAQRPPKVVAATKTVRLSARKPAQSRTDTQGR